MDKVGIIFLALLGGLIIGLIIGFVVGPIHLENSLFDGQTNSGAPPLGQHNVPDNSDDFDGGFEEIRAEPQEQETPMAGHPLVGRWEVINLVDIDPHNMDEIGAILEYFDDGTGIEHHSEEPLLREITWVAEGGRLTITPNDASFRIRSYDYEIEGNVFTIFFNTNRTSYFEAMRIPA